MYLERQCLEILWWWPCHAAEEPHMIKGIAIVHDVIEKMQQDAAQQWSMHRNGLLAVRLRFFAGRVWSNVG